MVTGATGLIGRRLANRWGPDVDVAVVDHRTTDLLIPGAFENLIRELVPDVVLHLAWSASGTRDYRNTRDNVRWSEVSLSAARTCLQLGSHFVGTGTGIDDGHPDDAYAESKQYLRNALAREIDDGSVTWCRPFYVFDPDEGRPAVFAEVRSAGHASRAAVLRQPSVRHDFIHVDDVAAAIITVTETKVRGLVDIGSGRLHSVADVATAAGVTWTHGQPSSSTVSHSGRVADTGVLRTLGWKPVETMRFFGDE